MNRQASSSLLPIKEHFYSGQIACRFLHPLKKTDSVILAIPGGPGLSSHYFDPFMRSLAERTGLNVATLDLPNHGDSKVSDLKAPLTYPDCLGLLKSTVAEIETKVGSLILFGHSLGARLVFDLMAQEDIAPRTALLTGFPYMFQISTALLSKLNDLPLLAEEGPDANKICEQNWRTILPLEVVTPLQKDTFEALARREHFPASHLMLQDAVAIADVAKSIKFRSSILIIEAEQDPVVPDDNWKILRGVVPSATFVKMDGVGHFPSAERPDAVINIFTNFIQAQRKNL